MSNLSDLLPAGGGQNNTDFVADGSITSGKPVILNSAGTVTPVGESTVSADIPYGSATDLSTSMNGSGQPLGIQFDPFNSGKVMAGFIDGSGYQNIRVGNYSGSTVTWGTTYVWLSDYIGTSPVVAFDPNNENEFVVILKETGPDYRVQPGTLSGTVPTMGVKSQFMATHTIQMTNGMVAFDSNNTSTRTGVLVYVGTDGYGKFYDRAFTVSGTGGSASITLGTQTEVDAGFSSEAYTSIAFNSTGTFVIGGRGDSTAYVFCYAGTVSGTTITRGTITQAASDYYAPGNVAIDPNAPTKFIISWNQSATNYSASVGTLSGTGNRTITFGTAQEIDNGDTGWAQAVTVFNPVTTGEFVMVHRAENPAPLVQASLGTYSGTTITMGTNYDFPVWGAYYGAACDISSGVFAVAYKNDTATDCEVDQGKFETQETNLTATNLLGIASGAILDTATGTINTWGSRNEVQTGLTIGSDYYVQSDGTITTTSTSPAQLIGTAISATQINIKDYTG